MKEKEIWRMIPFYANYAVSTFGRIRNLNTGRLLKHQTSKRGGNYPFVNLYRRGSRKNLNVHTIVAFVFLGIRPKNKVVHHKDGNRQNPRLDNLEHITWEKNHI